jgi:DNA repair exonuclease SbcCD ATPase subunit
MLKLKGLRLSGVGRFVEPQDVDFEHLGNLIQVDGENRNTGGSSGSGKSTLFNALDYLLGLNDLPVTVLQSRLTKDPISVRGEFDYDGKPLLITRNKKGLIIDLDGDVTEGSSKLSEEKLDAILGMPRDLFRKILHKRQKEGGFFLDFTPKKMYEFLTDALNLAAERKKLEKVEEKLKDLESKKSYRQNAILQAQSSLKAMQEAILGLGLPPVRDIHQSVIVELKGKYDASTQKCKKVEETNREETKELEDSRPKVSVSSHDTSERDSLLERRKSHESSHAATVLAERDRITGVHARIAANNLEKTKLDYQLSEADSAKKLAADLAGQIKKIRDAICPTCEQNWITENAKKTENDLLAKLSVCKDKITVGAQAKIRKDECAGLAFGLAAEASTNSSVNAQISQLTEEIAKINELLKEETKKAELHNATQNAANSSVLQQFATKQQELRQKHFHTMEQSRGQMDVDRRAFEAAVNKLKAYDDAAKKYDTTLSYMKTNEGVYFKELAENETQMSAISAEIEIAEELKKIVKSFISCSFDDALDTIGDQATKIIRCIPTMSNATIQFEGQKETKDGKIKEEVNAVISMDGEIGIPIKSLSGGERSSVDLAVDLAVIDFIESESSKGIDVFILDEPFTGLDTVSIEMALEVLKNSNSNKKLIVVDHNPEVKQMVSNRLIVVRDGSTSSITSQEVNNG